MPADGRAPHARIAAAGMMVLVLALAACAGQTAPEERLFYSGLAAYDQGRYAEAADRWQRAAEQGDIAAARNLGHLYRHGLGVEQDLPIALAWYQVAADAGLATAQYNVGMLYLQGGPKLDKDRLGAIYWLGLAGQAGIEPAAKALAGLTAVAPPIAEAPAPEALAPEVLAPEAFAGVPEPPAPPVAAEPRLRAQVGSYRSARMAERDWLRLSSPGIDHEIVAVRLKETGMWYRLIAVGGASALQAYCDDASRRRRECRSLREVR
jgi:uncharacterized protein